MGWEACSTCWLKLGCSCRVVLISAQHPIVYWSEGEKFVIVGVLMTNSKPAALTAWGKTGSWWGLQPPCTYLATEQIQQELLRSLSVQTPRFLVLQCGAAAERGGADRDYRALQAQSYLYSVYRFTLTHHGAGRSIKSAAAYHWKKRYLLSDIRLTKSKSIIYIWQLVMKQKPLCLHTDFTHC